MDDMINCARAMMKRDKELALLANSMADEIGTKVSAAQQVIIDTLSQLDKLTHEASTRDNGRRLEVNQQVIKHCRHLAETMGGIVQAANAMRAALDSSRGFDTVVCMPAKLSTFWPPFSITSSEPTPFDPIRTSST
jgi:hypothetical protein